ncbi:hypothetical protein [Nonomuraea glycinis]|uniref:hypothetical protein n=1 Tax=Nonomuraea glycinis TaxID=2047744 RepID=UPI002E1293FD|nr:hypothetical protein OHA68_43820 [Nonomuraea glycinis]
MTPHVPRLLGYETWYDDTHGYVADWQEDLPEGAVAAGCLRQVRATDGITLRQAAIRNRIRIEDWTSAARTGEISPQDCHGSHPAPPREGYTEITWSEPVPRCSSIRVRAHTCGCVQTSYELCSAAGLMRIRRTLHGGQVSESPWLPAAEAARLWESLLDGRAR